MNKVGVFCGSSFGTNPFYKEKAIELGQEIAKRGFSLVYGGGNKGLMGAIAHAVYECGGEVIGVLPKAMATDAVLNGSVHTRLIIVDDMHERKKTMYELSDGFIAMPGGIGTFEEVLEIFTWRQLGIHKHNIALYNPLGFWNYMTLQLQKAKDEGFITKEVLDTLIIEIDATSILDRLEEMPKELPSKI